MQIPSIETKSLGVSFSSSSMLFNDLSFSISEGEHIALTGPSGSGKTTLLRCILGLTEPSAGEILLYGQSLNSKSVWQLRNQISFVPQEADLGRGTVADFLERPFKYRINHAIIENQKNLPDLMQSVGLDMDRLDSKIGSLSGGEKQRIALVSALLLDRPILLLDEVASALDRDSAELVFSLLASLKDKTIIGVVHDEEKMPFATREIGIKGRDLQNY